MAGTGDTVVTMPQLGETVTEGTITRWLKKVGDQVTEDEPLFEVSTDKVDSEVPAGRDGYVSRIMVEEGETVDVGVDLVVISSSPPRSSGDDSAPDQRAEPDADPDEAADEPSGDAADEPSDDSDEAADEPSGNAAPTAAAAAGHGGGGGTQGGGRRVLSPLVRRLLADNDLDADDIEGTGLDGRITRNDVMAHLDRGANRGPAARSGARRPPAPERPAAPTAASGASGTGRPAGADDETIAFTNIRKRTAEHMVRSQATSAHVLTAVEVDFEGVDRVRRAQRDSFKEDEGFSLTYLPFVARAVIDAIRDFPHVNASVGDDELIVHRRIHLGIAVDINFEGLIVPVVHDADSKRLRSIAREIVDLAARARARKLNADEISGSTFTITNPGGYGTMITAPVINQPQVAIVSTDGVKKRPVAVELPDGTDGIAVHPVGVLAMSFDHRAFDGAYASAFLARVRDIIETRDWSQEL